MPIFLRCICILVLLIITSGITYSQEMKPLRENPINLVDDRAPSGKPILFTITLPKETEAEKVTFKIIFNQIAASAYVDKMEYTGDKVVYTIKATVPKYDAIFKTVERKWHEGWWTSRRANMNISVLIAQDVYEKSFSFPIPLRKTATFWGIVVLAILLITIALVKPDFFPVDKRFDDGTKDMRAKKWREHHPSRFKRMLLYPLSFAITPIGNYSISIAQILFWTSIVIFASIYVFVIRSEFLNVSGQVLILLGISGGTALAAKANGVIRGRDIPSEFFEGIERTRIPRLRDLISISGVPNIFKFQIFAFTLINGILVLKQLYTNFNFPVIPNEQLTLMGISSAVYFGNEIIRENDWETIEKKIKEAQEALDSGDTGVYNSRKAEIKNMLEAIYS